MRNLFKTFVLLLLICMIPTGTAKAARINRKKVTTEPGKIIVLSITSQTQNAKWSSSNKKVATVSKYGIVKAKKAGKCTITGTVGSKKYTCQVTVKKKAVYEDENNILKELEKAYEEAEKIIEDGFA